MTTLKALRTAVEAGRREEALGLLAGGVRAEADAGDRPLLFLAAQAGDLELSRALLQAGAPVDLASAYKVSPLAAAAERGHGPVVAALLAARARLERGEDGLGWLRACASGGLLELLSEELARLPPGQRQAGLTHGARCAARSGREEALALLLQAGAPVDDELVLAAAEGGLEERVLGWLGPRRPATLANAEGESLLHHACKGARSLRLVQLLLERGAQLNQPVAEGYYQGWTALHFAARANAPELARLLLSRGADPKAKAYFHAEPLMVAMGEQAPEAFLALLEAGGVDLNRKLTYQHVLSSELHDSTVLFWAIDQRRADLVKALLARGADPRFAGRYQVRPLHAAAKLGATDLLELLLSAGAPVDERGTYKDRTALMEAASAGQDEACRLLVSRGADTLARDKEDCSVLLHACEGGLTWLVRATLDREPGLANDHSRFNHRPLHEALSWGRAETARLLLERGADPNARDLLESAPILNAVHCPALLPELLARGVDPDAADKSGNTALSRAVDWGRLDLVEALLAGGARADGKHAWGSPLLVVAAGAGQLEIVERLLAHGADPRAPGRDRTALEAAMAGGHARVATRLQQALGPGALAAAVRPGTVTPLHLALARGDLAWAQELLARGHPAGVADARGRTPLHDAARLNRAALVGPLLAAGADPAAEDAQGFRPLHLAAQADATEALSALLQAAPAQVDVPTRTGHTAAHLAARLRLPLTLDRLAQAGASPARLVSAGALAGWTMERLLLKQPDREEWIGPRPCPRCGHRELWQTDYQVLHGNPHTPASDTEVEFSVGCQQCGASYFSVENQFRSLYARGGGGVWHWDRQRGCWEGPPS